MAYDMKTNLDLHQNSLMNARIQNLDQAPSTPKLGQIYFSDATGDNCLMVCTDAVTPKWAKLATGGNVDALVARVDTLETNVGVPTDTSTADTAFGKIAANTANIATNTTNIATNTSAIATINASDPMTSGITAAKVEQYDAYATGKQDALSTAQMNAVNSGIDSTKVTKLDGIAEGAQVNVVESVATSNNDTVTVTNKKATIDMSKYALKTEVASALQYKGTVASYADLPASGQKVGDVYNVTNADSTHGIKAGDNVAWSGTEWDVLGGVTDLSAYLTTAVAATTYEPILTGGRAAAADSGITAAKVAQYDAYATAIADKVDKLATKPTAGSYTKVTINAEGQVTAGANLAASDVPDIAISQVTGLQTALDGKVATTTTVNGHALSENVTVTKADIGLGNVADGAQVNIIEEIQKNGAKITPVDKVVNITVPTNNNELTNGAGYQTASDVSSAIGDAIDTAKADYYNKTAIQGFFTSQSVTTTGSGETYTASVPVTSGVPFMAQLLDENGHVVGAEITIGGSAVTVTTTSAFTGTLKILALPN